MRCLLYILYIARNPVSEMTILLHRDNTMNPRYNDIRYNSKIRYNVNLVCTKISGPCIFINIPMFFFRKTYILCIC